MLSKIAISAALVATASATFPPVKLQDCKDLAGAAQTACFQEQFDAQLKADADKAAADSKAVVDKQLKDALNIVKSNAAGLQGGLSARDARGATIAWCQGEFIAQFLALVGADECKKQCAQFAGAAVDTSSSESAFECLIPLTTKAVDDAKNQAERDAANDLKRLAGLLFLSTQFQKDNTVVITQNNNGAKVSDFSDNTKDLAFNADERTAQTILQTKANDNTEARLTEADANADALEKAFATFFIPKLEVEADVAASRETLRENQPFGDAAQAVVDAADARFQVIGVNGQPSNVVFTDLGNVDQVADAKFGDDLATFVNADAVLVDPNGKRAAKATEVGSFGQNDDEILANKIALVAFCQVKNAACKSSKQGVVSNEQLKEAQVETKAEEAERLAAEKVTTYYKETKKATKAPAGGYDAAPTTHHQGVVHDDSASGLLLAAGAVLSAIAMLL